MKLIFTTIIFLSLSSFSNAQDVSFYKLLKNDSSCTLADINNNSLSFQGSITNSIVCTVHIPKNTYNKQWSYCSLSGIALPKIVTYCGISEVGDNYQFTVTSDYNISSCEFSCINK